jgi:hypothetical protein
MAGRYQRNELCLLQLSQLVVNGRVVDLNGDTRDRDEYGSIPDN